MTIEEIISELESLASHGELDYVNVSDIISLIERIKVKPKPSISQIPEIWGDGWYALYDKEDNYWWVAPIKFFDEHGHCPDGWEWDKPAHMSDEEFEDFVNDFGCLPFQPKGFSYCMESCIQCRTNKTYEEQKASFEEAGYVVKIWKDA